MLKIVQAEYVLSSPNLEKSPQLGLPEFALVGRSNVGKSSFINCLTNRKKLAYTSNTPGKTRMINFYNIAGLFVLVDLPGYGYAKVSKTMKKDWKDHLEEFLSRRESLVAVFQIIDGRIPLQQNDILMRQWLNYHKIKTFTVITKTDSVKNKDLADHKKLIEETFQTIPFVFSAKSGLGKDKILNLIAQELVLS